MSKPKDAVRISLDLSPEANANLERLAEAIHGTKSDVLRRAVALFDLALDAEKKGLRIGAASPDKTLDMVFVGLGRR
jgi:predicted transcriptional regulator